MPQLFNKQAASPPEKKVDIGLYITFRQGNSGAAVHSSWEAVLGPGTGSGPNDIIHFLGPPGTRLWWFTIYSHLLCWIPLYCSVVWSCLIYFSGPVTLQIASTDLVKTTLRYAVEHLSNHTKNCLHEPHISTVHAYVRSLLCLNCWQHDSEKRVHSQMYSWETLSHIWVKLLSKYSKYSKIIIQSEELMTDANWKSLKLMLNWCLNVWEDLLIQVMVIPKVLFSGNCFPFPSERLHQFCFK